MEMWITCDSCNCKTFFGVKADPPVAASELRAQVIEKLGPDGAYICPRCGSLVFVCIGEEPIAGAARFQRAETARRIGESTKGLRFAVGAPAGPRSAVWRIWMNDRRDDVYIAARALASELKVSLHPEFWYFGFTKQHTRRGSSVVPSGSDRKMHVWSRPVEFGTGWTRAFSIVVPASEVVEASSPYTGSEAVWFPQPADGEAVHFTVLLSKPDAARGRRGYPNADGFGDSTEFLTRLNMTTGEQLWVLAHIAPMTDGETARLEKARAGLDDHSRQRLTARAKKDPTFSPRVLLFAESSDGVGLFFDIAFNDSSNVIRS
jgi:hypothetical protein